MERLASQSVYSRGWTPLLIRDSVNHRGRSECCGSSALAVHTLVTLSTELPWLQYLAWAVLNVSNSLHLWRCFCEPGPEVLLAEVNSPRSFSLTWQQSLPHPCNRKPPSQLQDLKMHEDPPSTLHYHLLQQRR